MLTFNCITNKIRIPNLHYLTIHLVKINVLNCVFIVSLPNLW